MGKQIYTFLIPKYYLSFKCKMGNCRNTCCVGWNISISLADYFKLQTLKCDEKTREKLDRCVKVHIHPTPERYAYIAHDYIGNCPLRMINGKCSLHAKFGENSLSNVCKLYPTCH